MTRDDTGATRLPVGHSARRRNSRGWYLLIGVASAIVLSGAIFWGFREMRNGASRNETRQRFLELAVDLVCYSEQFGRLPCPVRRESVGRPTEVSSPNGAGRPLYSWRVEIVPFLMSWHGSWSRSHAWNDPVNAQLVELSSFYSYDADEPSDERTESFPDTNILAITGPGTAFGDDKEPRTAMADVPPGTILAVESRASGIPWAAPGDFDIRTMPRTINASDGKGISSRHVGGFHVMFADMQVWFLSDKLSYQTLEKFFTIEGAERHDREKLLGPFALHRAGGKAFGSRRKDEEREERGHP